MTEEDFANHHSNWVEPAKTTYRGRTVIASGGKVRIADSNNFKAATTVAAGLVEVEPGGMREIHWHPNKSGWQ